MSKNLHQQYYKKYFEGIDFGYLQSNDQKALDYVVNRIKECNASLCAPGLLNDIPVPKCVKEDDCFKCFDLEVIYPGLVTGIGINHEAKIKGEFKLGIHFDWTWGMPVVYGSSVKGVLRAWFKEFYKGPRDSYDYEMEIFEGKLRNTEAEEKKYGKDWQEEVKVTKNRIYKPKSIYESDIFFDAVISAPDPKGRILCSDSITPHGDNPLKNPTPITFLKIAPGCKLEFRFKLVGSDEEKNFKCDLFKEILTTVGVGAKTNVGYGQLKVVPEETKK